MLLPKSIALVRPERIPAVAYVMASSLVPPGHFFRPTDASTAAGIITAAYVSGHI
jgi:hypothetical protein